MRATRGGLARVQGIPSHDGKLGAGAGEGKAFLPNREGVKGTHDPFWSSDLGSRDLWDKSVTIPGDMHQFKTWTGMGIYVFWSREDVEGRGLYY